MKYWYTPAPYAIKAYRHYILLDGGNKEGLLKPMKKATPTDEVVEWLNENIGVDNWIELHGMFLFIEKESAMAFLLKWS